MRKPQGPDRIASILRDDPGRPRRRPERQPGVPQGRYRLDHLLPLEGPPGEPRIEKNNFACQRLSGNISL